VHPHVGQMSVEIGPLVFVFTSPSPFLSYYRLKKFGLTSSPVAKTVCDDTVKLCHSGSGILMLWTVYLTSQYTLYGDAINHAARLMVKAKAGFASAKVICDVNTFHFGKSDEVVFLPLGAIQVSTHMRFSCEGCFWICGRLAVVCRVGIHPFNHSLLQEMWKSICYCAERV
jgi:hypothetical protein